MAAVKGGKGAGGDGEMGTTGATTSPPTSPPTSSHTEKRFTFINEPD